MREARFYIHGKNKEVTCVLCPHNCVIKESHVGICKVRENIDGTLYTKTYNQISSISLDPIEKKPLNNYKPGSQILSVGTFGCNFHCDFCQNYHISKQLPELEGVSVSTLLELSYRQTDSIGIAFTYNEPTIWYEYIEEIAKKHEKDTILVTNGFINEQPLKELLPNIQAMNIDLKSINDSFYKKLCKGDLAPVIKAIKIAYEQTHIELTFLAIPQINDSDEEIIAIAKWIASIDKNIPLHIIGFRPMYKMSNHPFQTSNKITHLKQLASKYLRYVY